MIDVKKLITGFLILAIALGASALIVSTIGSSSPAAATTLNQATLIGEPTSSVPDGGNAFIAQANNQDSVGVTSGDLATTSVSASDPNNLTDVLADAYMSGVVGTNQNGPTEDANGNPVLTPPDPTGIANVVANASATLALKIPDWNAEVASQPVRVLPNPSQTDVAQYGAALNDALTGHLNAKVDDIVSNLDTANANDLSYIAAQIQQALGDTLALQTPAQFTNLQKDLVASLVYDKNSLQLLALAQTDPVKASMIFQSEDANFQSAQQKLQDDINRLTSSTVALQENPTSPNAFVAMVDRALGIQTAHAQFVPTTDPMLQALISSIHVQDVAQKLEAIVKNTLLQILKNTLIALIQRKVLTWIQGSGAPRFVTNWSTELVNSYTQKALTYLNSKYSCTYSGLLPQVTLMLKLPYTNSSNNICANTFQAALGGHTLQQFYNNFSQGGWLAFGASSLPTNDYYGSLYFNSVAVGLNARNAQQATQNSNIASQGAKGDRICTDGSNPNGIFYTCTDKNGNTTVSNSPCPKVPGMQQEAAANNGTCTNGARPNDTTPGIFTVNTESVAGGGTTQQVSAANDIVGLLNSITNSLLMGLANAAVNAASNGINGILSVNPTSIQGGGTSPAALPLSCTPSTQTVQRVASSTPSATILAGGGTTDANGNPPTYNWRSSDGTSNTGSIFTGAYTIPGTYTVTLSDSANDTPVTCSATVQ